MSETHHENKQEHNHESSHRTARYVRYALIILCVLLLALIIFFVVQYRSLRRQYFMNLHQFEISQLLEHHAPIAVSNADEIRSWMTFDYINKLFGLPPTYLQTNLKITDSHYPHTTIASYAKTENASATIMTTEVENAVRTYVAPPQNSTST